MQTIAPDQELAGPLIPIVEVSRLLAISIPTVRRFIRAGAIPSVKIGRSRRVARDVVERALREGLGVPMAGEAR